MSLLATFGLADDPIRPIRFGRRKQGSSRLIDSLVNGQRKSSSSLPATPRGIGRIQAVIQDLFADTRRQQVQSLDTTYADEAAHNDGQTEKRGMALAVAGFGLASAGALIAPIFYLPSIAVCTYTFREIFAQPYRLFVDEKKLDYRAVLAFSVAAAFAGGYIAAASFGGVLYMLNIYLLTKTEDRSKRSIVDLFGGQVRSVWLFVYGVEVETPIHAVDAGDTVVVHAGQMIPVDGVITSGTATVDLVLAGQGTVACDTPVAPTDAFYLKIDCPRDIERARELLAEAGYADGLDVTLYTLNMEAWMIPLTEVYQQQAADAGINVKLEIVPADNYFSDIMMIAPFYPTFWRERPADLILNLIWRSTAQWNESYYQNPEFDQLLDEARQTLDFESRRDLYQQAQQILIEDGGTFIPFYTNLTNIYSANVSGIGPISYREFYWETITKSE